MADARVTVEVSLVIIDKPWRLSVDAIVLSVGEELGDLGLAVQQHFPRAPWPSDFSRVTPSAPGALRLRENNDGGLWLAVFASPHGSGGVPTPGVIGRATAAAISHASSYGARTIAVPMLGTGALGMDIESVAAVAVPSAIDAAQSVRMSQLAFVARTGRDSMAIEQAVNRYQAPQTKPEQPVELAGGVTTDRVDPTVGIPLADDQLGVAPYVSMLATVIADRITRTPLAIGIFGEWGAGKSYFMGLLRNSVSELTKSGNPDYCGDIAQISFNAWHYADSNLWASLGDEIFRQLAEPTARPEDQRGQLRAELSGLLDQRRDLDARAQQAKEAAAELQAQLDRATERRFARATDLINALRQSPELRNRVTSLFDKLGVSADVEQTKLLIDELSGSLSDAEALNRGSWDRRGRLIVPLAIFALASCAVIAAFAPEIRGALAWLSGGLGVVLAAGVTVMARARSGLRALRTLVTELRSGVTTAARVRAARELDALRSAETDQQVAEAQLHEVMSHIGELGRQLSELSPGRRLYSFLASRAQDGTYQKNLSLISMIRKDFEQLVALLADWRAHPDAESGHRPIDRIVLYVDDLDRCGPRQVVDVLQAVHLLLALDLFVVVIGVDPRWLVRSLRDEYAAILGEEIANEPGIGKVIPEDYLEKIINIPLVLSNMAPGSLNKLLRAIDDKQVGAPVVAASQPQPEPEIMDSAGVGEFEVEEGSEVAQQTGDGQIQPTRVGLTEPELDLLSALDALINTPREAKRLFNIYRMIRATRDLSDASRFLGGSDEPGEYQAVAILLGLLTAHPLLLPDLLDGRPDLADGVAGGLLRRRPDEEWATFVADCVPVDGHNGIVGELPSQVTDEWARLGTGLSRASTAITLPDLSIFQQWVPRLRRFSYRLSH